MVLLVVGLVLVLGGAVSILLGQPTGGLASAVIGVLLILIRLFRRRGRPGDFSRSGSTGL